MIKYVCDMCGKEVKSYEYSTVTIKEQFLSPSEYHICQKCYEKLTKEILAKNN